MKGSFCVHDGKELLAVNGTSDPLGVTDPAEPEPNAAQPPELGQVAFPLVPQLKVANGTHWLLPGG
jgi:hypothetical protein